MKEYAHNSVMTIRQRIQNAYKHMKKHDPWVSVYDNTSGDSVVFGFYLSDWENEFDDFQSFKELDYRLDTETRSTKGLNLGFDGYSPNEKRFTQ